MSDVIIHSIHCRGYRGGAVGFDDSDCDCGATITALTERLAAANADIDRLNQMLRATGYGQGQIDAYDDECEARERAEERLASAEEAARWWRMAARGYILEEGEVHPDERWPWLADEAAKGGCDVA